MRLFIVLLLAFSMRVFAEPPAAAPELIRTLHEGIHFKPYGTREAWQKRAEFLREQVLISAGLWPMPEKCPLNAVIHGRIERDGYTVEKVYFQSYPGFYVTGNLYRPTNKKGPFPAVLSPHGHWDNGRFYEATPDDVANQIKHGWEKEPEAARYPLQARCASLAKLGCVVFFYDMVGYGDADPEHFVHRRTYRDIDSDLRGLGVFGLQTWDSIRSLDFLTSLPDVDPTRLAITGASGGGTQSFVMMAIEPRLAAAAPVNMISPDEHQGGCVCENNSLLRVGTDNVELAATFAPRPFIHPTATGDWTKDFLEHGFPEIKATYKLFGAEDNVESMRQTAPHNYNLHAREAVYNFFNKHLRLGHDGVIAEPKFTPVKPKDLSVWDAEHTRPANAVDAAGLKQWWVEMTGRQMEDLKPKDAAGVKAAEAVLRPVLTHVVGERHLAHEYESKTVQPTYMSDIAIIQGVTTSTDHEKTTVRMTAFVAVGDARHLKGVIVALPGGSAAAVKSDGSPIDLVITLAKSGRIVLVPDLFTASRNEVKTAASVEFFTGYNPSATARRVRELLVLIDAKGDLKPDLIALGDTAPAALLARAAAPDGILHAIIDASALNNLTPTAETDANFIPHLLRYGGIWPLASLGGVSELTLLHTYAAPAWLEATYSAAGADDKLHIEKDDAKPEDIVRWLSR